MDNFGVIGLAVGLWIALSPSEHGTAGRGLPAGLGWLLAATSALFLMTVVLGPPASNLDPGATGSSGPPANGGLPGAVGGMPGSGPARPHAPAFQY